MRAPNGRQNARHALENLVFVLGLIGVVPNQAVFNWNRHTSPSKASTFHLVGIHESSCIAYSLFST